MAKLDANLYKFGPFRVDTVKRLLLRDENVVPLPPKAFETLLTLIENSDRVVEKAELMNAIWPDSFVEEANLAQNVSMLRKALSERAGEHRYIVTVPGRGYRFVGAANELRSDSAPGVSEPGPTPVSSGDIPPSPALQMSPTRNAVLVSLVILSLILMVAAISYFKVLRDSARLHNNEQAKSIAVLPFKLIGPEGGDQYLGVGMADTLITSLSSIKHLVVRPTSAVLKYTNGTPDPLAAGREQRVEAVLDGSIQKAQGRTRVTARLLNVQDGSSLWAGSFDAKDEDIFRLQDSVVEKLTGALMMELTGTEHQRLTRRSTENVEAYHAYLRGRFYWNKRTADAIRKAIEQFQEAINRDPNYALGYAGLADAYRGLEQYAGVPLSEVLPKAKAATDRALELDDSLAEAHTSLAMIYRRQFRWAEAEQEFRRATGLNANYPTAHQWFGLYYLTRRKLDEALKEAKRAQELDPLSPIVTDQVAFIYLLKNDILSVIEQTHRNMEVNPAFPGTHYLLGSAYFGQHRHEEAHAEFQKAIELSGRASRWLAALAYFYGATGRRTEALGILKELEERFARHEALAENVAQVYAGLGDKDQAFRWLEKELARGGDLPYLTTSYSYESLRSDARYSKLVEAMGLD